MEQNSDHVQQREVRNMLRTVWLDDQYVTKEYKRLRGLGDLRQPWKLEHNALMRLNACNVIAPKSFGYKKIDSDTVQYKKQFIDGSFPSSLENKYLEPLVSYLVDMHKAGVTLCDPSLENLIITKDDSPLFIDFGRASVFSFKSPLFYFYVGKEIIRFRRQMFKDDLIEWQKFSAMYDAQANYPGWAKKIISLSKKYWIKRWGVNAGA